MASGSLLKPRNAEHAGTLPIQGLCSVTVHLAHRQLTRLTVVDGASTFEWIAKPWILAMAWVLGLGVVALTLLWVPWHMDEFVMFHRLACTAPTQQLDPGPLGCSGFRSEFLGFEFHRSYSYIGFMSSLLLWPFWQVWPSLVTVWAVGVVFLAAIGLGLLRSFRVPVRYGFIVLLLFPLVVSVIHDGGPVRLSLLVIAWSPWLLQRVMQAKGVFGAFGWGALLVLGVIAAVEDKPYFMYLLPGTIALSVAALPRWQLPQTRQHWLRGCALWGAALLASLIELLVIRVDGMSYLAFLGKERPPLDARPVQALADLIRWSYDWPMWAHRVIEYPNPSIPLLAVVGLVAVMPVLLGLVWWGAGRSLWLRRESDVWTGVALVAATVLFAAGAIWSGGWAGHHYIYVYLPLFVAALLLWQQGAKGRRMFIAVALAFSSLLTLFVIRVSPILPTSSPFIGTVMDVAYAAAEQDDIINCASFGCGWQDLLLNRGDIPVFMGHWNAGDHADAMRAARDRNGRIIHVCSGCDQSAIEQQYPGAVVDLVGDPGASWKVFQVDPR